MCTASFLGFVTSGRRSRGSDLLKVPISSHIITSKRNSFSYCLVRAGAVVSVDRICLYVSMVNLSRGKDGTKNKTWCKSSTERLPPWLAAHFFDWLTFSKSPNQNYFRCAYSRALAWSWMPFCCALSPGQTIATFQRNISQHCCIMLRHVAEGLAKRTQHHATVYTIVSANIYGP